MFKWKVEYETGNQVVDEQHKRLFSIADKAYELLKNDLYIDKYDRIIEIINELKDYTIFHFKSEEEYMIKTGFRKFLSHKVEHDDFIAKLEEVDLRSVDDNQNQYVKELLEFVFNWISEHILIKDKQHSSTK